MIRRFLFLFFDRRLSLPFWDSRGMSIEFLKTMTGPVPAAQPTPAPPAPACRECGVLLCHGTPDVCLSCSRGSEEWAAKTFVQPQSKPEAAHVLPMKARRARPR